MPSVREGAGCKGSVCVDGGCHQFVRGLVVRAVFVL